MLHKYQEIIVIRAPTSTRLPMVFKRYFLMSGSNEPSKMVTQLVIFKTLWSPGIKRRDEGKRVMELFSYSLQFYPAKILPYLDTDCVSFSNTLK